MAPIYLRTDSGTWHWCRDCKGYPPINAIAETRIERPVEGQLCDECESLEREGRCEG